jgi:hypothetical protein
MKCVLAGLIFLLPVASNFFQEENGSAEAESDVIRADCLADLRHRHYRPAGPKRNGFNGEEPVNKWTQDSGVVGPSHLGGWH